MSIEFKLPEVSEGVESVDVAEILVSEGDTIEADQVVAEVETEKSVAEIECPHAGVIAKIHVSPGDSVSVGGVLLTIEESNGAPAKAEEPKDSAPEKDDEKAAEPKEEPKQEQKAPAASKPAASPAPSAPAPATTPAPADGEERPPAPAGPATRRLARDLGVDLYAVSGSGPGGRISQEDVQEYVKARLNSPAPSGGGGGIAPPPLPDFSKFGETERERLNKIAKTAANNLSMSWNVIPHVTQHDLADITELEAARRHFLQGRGKDGPKVTMTAIAIKAVVTALKVFPKFNSSLDSETMEIVLKKYYNIGVAVDTPNGLLVPVVKDVDKKTILEIAADVTDLAVRARDRKLTPEDQQGACFTITNLGGIGGTSFTPIVNYPEVAILGMSRGRKELHKNGSELEERLLLPLSMSYDHRVINGADAARFIVKLSALLSDPFTLLAEC